MRDAPRPEDDQTTVPEAPWNARAAIQPEEPGIEQPAGWVSPPDASRPRGLRRLAAGCTVLVVLAVVGSLVATLVLDMSPRAPEVQAPDLQSVAFGTGGSGCTITGVASSFPLGVEIRDVVTFSPALPTGASVQIRVEHNGTELTEMREALTIEEPAPCIHGAMTPPESGHYRVVYEISPSSLPPISGEFDVTS
jgi:hypothetical protein